MFSEITKCNNSSNNTEVPLLSLAVIVTEKCSYTTTLDLLGIYISFDVMCFSFRFKDGIRRVNVFINVARAKKSKALLK